MKTIRVFLKIFFSLFFFLLFVYGHGQYTPPAVIPPSPTAASLGNFGDIPVGYYTGTPDISVPLYEIKTKDLSLPITLSYNATGVRVAQDASWVGLNWSLLAGGLVSRVVRGKDDFGTGGYYWAAHLPNSSNLNQYYSDVWNNFIDGEPDIFSYNFAGYSGRFLVDKQVNGGVIYMSDRNNLDIKFVPGESFTITTPDGIQYSFGTKESITNRYTLDYNGGTGPDPANYVGLGLFNSASGAANSSWFLDKITSPSGDEINFIYKTGQSLGLISRSLKHYLNLNPNESGPLPEYHSKVDFREYIEDVMLQRIVFTNGRIEFETTPREDIEAASTTVLPQKLSRIKVYNNSQSTPVKDITLGQSYFTASSPYIPNDPRYYDKRLRLDYVQINQDANRYSFSYYMPMDMPSKYSRLVDEWGFYTSYFDNPFKYTTSFWYPDMYPRVATPVGVIDGIPLQRGDATGDYVKMAILTSITYPTKGRTEFDFEPNDYGNVDPHYYKMTQTAILDYTDPLPENWITGPENAIQTINLTQNTSVTFSAYTSYTSEPTQIGYLRNSNGVLLFTFTNTNNSDVESLDAGQYTIEVKEISGQMTKINAVYDVYEPVPVQKGGGLRIRAITNYDANNSVAGKKTFDYNVEGGNWSSGLLLSKLPNYYFRDIIYNDGNCEPHSPNHQPDKRGYYMVRSANSLFPEGFYSMPNVVAYSRVSVKDGINGNNGTTVYNYYNLEATDELNPYPMPEAPALFDSRNGQLLSVEIHDAAGSLVKKTENEYTKKEDLSLIALKPARAPFEPDRICPNALDDFVNLDLVYPYNNFSEWYVQSKITETNYFNNGLQTVVNTTTNNFDNAVHKQITSSETLQSDNTTRVTTYKYPHDFSGQQPYADMVNNKHMWAPVIEQSTFKTAGTASTLLNAVKANYDFWDGSGWTTSPTNMVVKKTVESKVGQQTGYVTRLRYNTYDNIGNVGTVSMENNVAKTYLWGYNKMYPVAEITNTDYATAIQYVDPNILNNPPDDATFRQHLNNLRNIAGAQVTTYTYNPLVGMTSQTDVNGRTSYYDYDDLGRLALIRDQDHNVMRKICYNYIGQQGSCDFLGNAVQTKVFYKSGCDNTAGLTGAPVTYTVPANKYFGASQAQADALAQAEINANGQAKADQNGTCVVAHSNVAKSQTFTKSCSQGGVPSTVTYTVPAGTYYAYSQQAADQLAQDDVNANGQTYANNNGSCTWYNDRLVTAYQKSCSDGGSGSVVEYVVPQGTYSSTASAADANNKAVNDANANGQNFANANGACTWYNWEMSINYQKNDCSGNSTGTSSTYVVPANKYSSTISMDDAYAQAEQDLYDNGQTYANDNGSCVLNTINILYDNSGDRDVDVWFYSTTSDSVYYFNIPPYRTQVPLAIPPGTYDIFIWPDDSGRSMHYFTAGCGYWATDYSVMFYGVSFADDQYGYCNTVSSD